VGALIIRAGTPFEPLLVGGAQETRYRAGTENVPGIVAFGIAAAAVGRELDARISKMAADRRRLEMLLAEVIPGARFNHPKSVGLPNTISLTAPGIRADDVVVALDLKGIYVSSGAACASGKPEPSHVLRALGLSNDDARATLRISLRADHSADELTHAAHAIAEAIARGRGL